MFRGPTRTSRVCTHRTQIERRDLRHAVRTCQSKAASVTAAAPVRRRGQGPSALELPTRPDVPAVRLDAALAFDRSFESPSAAWALHDAETRGRVRLPSFSSPLPRKTHGGAVALTRELMLSFGLKSRAEPWGKEQMVFLLFAPEKTEGTVRSRLAGSQPPARARHQNRNGDSRVRVVYHPALVPAARRRMSGGNFAFSIDTFPDSPFLRTEARLRICIYHRQLTLATLSAEASFAPSLFISASRARSGLRLGAKAECQDSEGHHNVFVRLPMAFAFSIAQRRRR